MLTLKDHKFDFPGQQSYYTGKVRDIYNIGEKLIMVVSDRISAFDHILSKAIPYKGQVLNQIAAFFLEETKDIVPNWWVASPDPNVSVGLKCEPIRIEMVIRGYMAGHAAREYASGKRKLCGVVLPEGLKEGDKFPNPIITPAIKALEGHDVDASLEVILESGIVTENQYAILEKFTYQLFERGTAMAEARGLLLVDTKYEFGFYQDEIILMDEIHTPDSSRYYYSQGYQDRQARGEKQKQLSKEFVREWLMEHGFQGKEKEIMPVMPDSFVDEVSARYIELYEHLTGKPFVKPENQDIISRIEENVQFYLEDSL